MILPEFKHEIWMTRYEKQAQDNLTDTCPECLSLNQLLSLDHSGEDLVLDYGDIPGEARLRKQILSLYENRLEDTLALGVGAVQCSQMVMDTLLSGGDHVLVFYPDYPQFAMYPKSLGVEVHAVALKEENGWLPDWQQLEQALHDYPIRAIIFANPSNPCGGYLKKQELEKLISLCRPYGIWIVCDEVYRFPDHINPSISDLYEKGVAISSLSKMMGLPAIRLGWIKASSSLINAINVRRDYTMISTGPVLDHLACIALENRGLILEQLEEIRQENIKDVKAWLDKEPAASCILPEKGTVAFLKLEGIDDTESFCRDLLEQTGIFFAPGCFFGMEGYVRLGLGKKHHNLSQTLERISSFLQTVQ